MTYPFKIRCDECGSNTFNALTDDHENPSVEALECTSCGNVIESDTENTESK